MAVAMRFLVTSIDPITLALIRIGTGVLCLLPAAFLTSGRPFALRDMLPMTLLGVTFFALFTPGFGTALKYTTATRAATEMALAPIVTVLFASVLGRETLTRNKVFGALLSFLGVAFVVSDPVTSNPLPHSSLIGDLIVLGLVGLIAVFNTLSRPYLKKYPPIRVTTYFMACGWTALCCASIAADLVVPLPDLTSFQWLVLLYLCTVVSAIPSFLYHWALGLNPISAAFFGVILLSESMTWNLFGGLVLVLAGIFLSTLRISTDG